MNGAGNDFVLVDKNKNVDFNPTKNLIIELCDRRKGIGADGILFIKKSEKHDFELEYYNSDGSLGSLCGNGARCSIKYIFDNYLIDQDKTTFLCNNQIFNGEKIDTNRVKFYLNSIDELRLDEKIVINGSEINTHFLDNGSPHVVIFWEEFKQLTELSFEEMELDQIGKQIRYSEYYKPHGTNVNIIKIENDFIKIRTYERGVENETLACGTGTVASAIIASIKKNVKKPVEFLTFGNDKLLVDFEKNNNKFVKITLTGPAKINYIGTYNF